MANGLGGLIGTGLKTKQQAQQGLLQSARLEAQQKMAQDNLEQQKAAADQQLIGTLAGTGAAIGAAGATSTKFAAVAGAAFPPALIGAAIGFALTKLFD